MTISRVNAGGWGVGDKLTSTQANGLDLNGTYALDKRAGQTDTLASTVSLSGEIDVAATGVIDANANGSKIRASANGAKIAATAAGATIRTETGGRLEHADDDYPTLAVGHTGRTVTRIMNGNLAVGITTIDEIESDGTGYLYDAIVNATNGVRTDASLKFNIVQIGASEARATTYDLDEFVLNGATLSSVAVRLAPAGAHAGLPFFMPRIRVYRTTAGSSNVGLHVATAISDTSANVAAYEVAHTVTATCTQNNVIDKTQYSYHLVVWNEGGGNALVGMQVGDITLTMAITDLRTP